MRLEQKRNKSIAVISLETALLLILISIESRNKIRKKTINIQQSSFTDNKQGLRAKALSVALPLSDRFSQGATKHKQLSTNCQIADSPIEMQRRTFLKALIAVIASPSMPIYTISAVHTTIETSFAEQYAKNLHTLAAQKESRFGSIRRV